MWRKLSLLRLRLGLRAEAVRSLAPSERRHAAVRRWDGRLLMNLISVNNLRGCGGTYTAPMRYKTNGSY